MSYQIGLGNPLVPTVLERSSKMSIEHLLTSVQKCLPRSAQSEPSAVAKGNSKEQFSAPALPVDVGQLPVCLMTSLAQDMHMACAHGSTHLWAKRAEAPI